MCVCVCACGGGDNDDDGDDVAGDSGWWWVMNAVLFAIVHTHMAGTLASTWPHLAAL